MEVGAFVGSIMASLFVSVASVEKTSLKVSSNKISYDPGSHYPYVDTENEEIIGYYVGGKNLDADFEEKPTTVDDADVNTPDDWMCRHNSLIRLTGRHPFNCEPPLSLLYKKGFITPQAIHYVRTHGSTPHHVTWENWVIHVGGLSAPLNITMADLIGMPLQSLPVTLVCCGNRRKEQNMIKQTIGFNWGAAGVSTAGFLIVSHEYSRFIYF